MKRIEKPRLQWITRRGKVIPRHRKVWIENGNRRERTIDLKWNGDPKELDRLYWLAETGELGRKKGPKSSTSWGALIREWRSDPKVQRKLADGTKRSYRRIMDALLAKNADKDVRQTTKAHVRAIHNRLKDTPRKADHYLQVLRLLWNYARKKLDWPLGENPAEGIDLYGPMRRFKAWPDWMVASLTSSPADVRTMGELLLGTGQRPGAAAKMRWEDFQGDWMTVTDEKADTRRQVYCPVRLRRYLATLPRRGRYVLAKNLTEPLGYDAIEKQFREWRRELGPEAKEFTLHGLRKLAVVQLAEAGCTDAEIQAVTGQSLEMVAFYRKDANARMLSKAAQERRE